jgi:hypothetical protein
VKEKTEEISEKIESFESLMEPMSNIKVIMIKHSTKLIFLFISNMNIRTIKLPRAFGYYRRA